MFLKVVYISAWINAMFGSSWSFQYIFENQILVKIVSDTQSQNTN